MRLLTLKARIQIISVVGLMSAALLVTSYVATRALEQRQAAYETSIQNLVFSSKQSIRQAQTFDQRALARHTELLASAQAIQNVSLIDDQRRIIAHAGETYTPPINPSEFPQDGYLLLERGQYSVYIEAIDTVDETGSPDKVWLIALADRKPLISAKNKVIRTGIVIFLFTAFVSLAVSRYLTGLLVKYLRSFEQILTDVYAGKKELELSSFKHQDLAVIEELLADIGTQMYNYRTDITEEIEQTTRDLRETLETIEIQNVELDIARKHAIQANNAKSEFLANMSHEIRTPLNGIIGFAKILMRSPLNSQQADTLRAIQKSSEVLLMIINDILDFSKVEAGRFELEQEALNFYELIEDIVVMLAPSAHHKGLELNYLYYEDAPRLIVGDSLRLKQVITNLVNNAVKFTHQGEVIIRIMLDDSLDRTLGNLKIAISDTGIGLSSAEQTNIFKAFSQADASTARQFGGTGLGLSICRGLVHEMGGDIDFESKQGEGATFWFTLPLNKELLAEKGGEVLSEHSEPPFDIALECLLYEPHSTSRQSIQHILSSLNIATKSLDSLTSLLDSANSSAAQGNSFALICIDESDLDAPDTMTAFKQLKAQSIHTLLFTPTLKNYDHRILSICDAHALKPATAISLRHSISGILSLPVTQALAEERKLLANDASQKPVGELALLSSKHRILAVDDNEMNLSLVRALIHEMGLEVDLAEGGEEALTLCRQYFYPLILMDIQMPDMDGVSCLKALRNFAQYRNAGNVVALTAYALPREKNEFIQQGFVDLITKPLDEAKLQAIILRYLPQTKRVADLETSKSSDLESLQPVKSPRPGKSLQPVKNPQQIESLPPENAPPRADAKDKQSAPLGASIQRSEQSYEEDFENLPIFDWNESVHLSNGNESLAREFAQKLFLTLPEAHKDIRASFKAKDKDQLLHSVHKLHGVTLLCGIPKLRYLAYRAEDSLKTGQNESSLNNIIEALLDAVEELIDCGDHVLATHAPV